MNDFDAFIEEIGVTRAAMDAAAEAMPVPLPKSESERYRVGLSPIHGTGCFATHDIDGVIGKMRCGNDWYEAGRFINHSATPNATAKMQGNTLFACGTVCSGDEITLDYRQVRDTILRIS